MVEVEFQISKFHAEHSQLLVEVLKAKLEVQMEMRVQGHLAWTLQTHLLQPRLAQDREGGNSAPR